MAERGTAAEFDDVAARRAYLEASLTSPHHQFTMHDIAVLLDWSLKLVQAYTRRPPADPQRLRTIGKGIGKRASAAEYLDWLRRMEQALGPGPVVGLPSSEYVAPSTPTRPKGHRGRPAIAWGKRE